MSSASTSYSGGLLTTQFTNGSVFVWEPRFRTGTYTNGTGSAVNLTTGTLMGVISSSNKLTPHVSTATDGSQVPRGVLAHDYTVANGATVTLSYCFQGDVDSALLTFGGSDTLATAITLTDSATNTVGIGTIEQLLVAIGINPITVTENTLADN